MSVNVLRLGHGFVRYAHCAENKIIGFWSVLEGKRLNGEIDRGNLMFQGVSEGFLTLSNV